MNINNLEYRLAVRQLRKNANTPAQSNQWGRNFNGGFDGFNNFINMLRSWFQSSKPGSNSFGWRWGASKPANPTANPVATKPANPVATKPTATATNPTANPATTKPANPTANTSVDPVVDMPKSLHTSGAENNNQVPANQKTNPLGSDTSTADADYAAHQAHTYETNPVTYSQKSSNIPGAPSVLVQNKTATPPGYHPNYNFDALPKNIQLAIENRYLPAGRDPRYYALPNNIAKAEAKLGQAAWSTAQAVNDSTADYIEQSSREIWDAQLPEHIRAMPQGDARDRAIELEYAQRQKKIDELEKKYKTNAHRAVTTIGNSQAGGYVPSAYHDVYKADRNGMYMSGSGGNRDKARIAEGLDVYNKVHTYTENREFDKLDAADKAKAEQARQAQRDAILKARYGYDAKAKADAENRLNAAMSAVGSFGGPGDHAISQGAQDELRGIRQ